MENKLVMYGGLKMINNKNIYGYVNKPPTKDDISIMIAKDTPSKILASQTRILEWYMAWDNMCYISFSGGKDSSVLAHMVCQTLDSLQKKPDVYLLFLDTGLEYPEIRKFVHTYTDYLRKSFPKLNIILDIKRPKLRFDEVIKKWGYPYPSKEVAMKIHEARSKTGGAAWQQLNGTYTSKNGKTNSKSVVRWKYLLDCPYKISHRCCFEMKKNPAKRYERATGRHPITAMTAEESFARKSAWIKNGCNAFDAERPISNPMFPWNDQDIYWYIKYYGLPICSVYGNIVNDDGAFKTTGLDRTGCMFCLFGIEADGTPNRLQIMKETHPIQYEYCMRNIDEGGLGLKDFCEWANIPYK